MDYVVVVVASLLSAGLVSAILPVVAEIAAGLIVIGVPIGLCIAIANGSELPISDPTDNEGTASLAVVAAIAGAWAGAASRQLTVYAQAGRADSARISTSARIYGLEQELGRLRSEIQLLRGEQANGQ